VPRSVETLQSGTVCGVAEVVQVEVRRRDGRVPHPCLHGARVDAANQPRAPQGGPQVTRVDRPDLRTRSRSSGCCAGPFSARDEPRTLGVATARPDLQQNIRDRHGDVGRRWHGIRVLVTAGADRTLTIFFHDGTNDAETAPWRAGSTKAPAADGSVVVEFNRVVNLPFTFTDHSTCPAPAAGAPQPVPGTAGERRPR
jgi:hypothetical protein